MTSLPTSVRLILATGAGAILAGIIGAVFVPELFWALLVGGALSGGAIGVAWLLGVRNGK